MVSTTIALMLLAVVAGFTLPIQAGINAHLSHIIRSPILAAAVSFAVGTMGLSVYALILRTPLPPGAVCAQAPWWVWSGGLLGAFFVAATVVLALKMGAAPMVAFRPLDWVRP